MSNSRLSWDDQPLVSIEEEDDLIDKDQNFKEQCASANFSNLKQLMIGVEKNPSDVGNDLFRDV